VGLVVFEKLGFAEADRTGVLANIAGIVDASRELGKFFRFNCVQVSWGDPCGLCDFY
jgi:hypothetical protein